MADPGSATVTLTKLETLYDLKGAVKCVVAWIGEEAGYVGGDGVGTVPATALISASDYTKYLAGRECVLAVTDPGATAPTASYDITITDEYGVDVFGGALINRSATASEQALPLVATDTYGPRPCFGIWTFNLSGNSVSKALGVCTLYFR